MALHSHHYGSPSGLPLAVVLASIPSYPRPVIERLVARLIDHLDDEDGDSADLEDSEGQIWPHDERGRWLIDASAFDTDDDEDTHDHEREDVEGMGFHSIDQREVAHQGGAWREE